MSTPRGMGTPSVVKSAECRSGSSTVSRIVASCLETPPTSS